MYYTKLQVYPEDNHWVTFFDCVRDGCLKNTMSSLLHNTFAKLASIVYLYRFSIFNWRVWSWTDPSRSFVSLLLLTSHRTTLMKFLNFNIRHVQDVVPSAFNSTCCVLLSGFMMLCVRYSGTPPLLTTTGHYIAGVIVTSKCIIHADIKTSPMPYICFKRFVVTCNHFTISSFFALVLLEKTYNTCTILY